MASACRADLRVNVAVADAKWAVTPAGVTQGFQTAMAAIRNTVRLSALSDALFAVGDRKFQESRIF